MAVAEQPGRDFDLNDPVTVEHLHEVFAEMREHCPITFSERHGGYWVITGYETLVDAAKDWQTLTSAEGLVIPPPPVEFDLSRSAPPLSADPPLHRLYRKILNPYFTPEAVAKYEPGIRQTANDLIDEFAGSGECDLLGDFAIPFPALVLLEHVVGMPKESIAKFHQILSGAGENLTTGRDDPILTMEFQILLTSEVKAYLDARADEPPRGDVIDAVRTGEIDGQPLTLDEQIGMVRTLFLAAAMTTTDAIAQGGFYLAGHPEARERLLADPSLFDAAAEEFLRLSSPVTADGRRVTSDVEWCGQELKQGQQVYLAFGAANRDPAEFPDPDRWDPDRPNVHRQVAFGSGHHHCLGSHLARLELKVSLQEILRRFPDMQLVDGAVFKRRLGAGSRPEKVPVLLK